ncbi:MAG: DNA primase [Lachnospiraceae bacterium]|nr:DNA primase [Lachnospiraceae bacterium]
MYYSDELVAQVRQSSDIVDVVGSYISLTKKGANYVGICPFHNDHSPSFSVSRSKQIYKCFACGEAGNVITFVMKYENITFVEAVKLLADRSGIKLPEVSVSAEEKRKSDKKLRLLEVNKEAATFFYRCLRSPHGERGMKYFKDRGLSDDTINKFGLGFAGVNGREVVDVLRKKGFSDEEIRDSGIASVSEKNGLSSPFWNRVMYPIMDANHRVIGFGGRVLGDAKPKYLNSPETDIFDKRRNLYGFVFARNSRAGNFILCEGYMDVIAMHQAGFSQAVASLGTAFTQEQANLLSRYTKKVFLAYDSDGPGVKAALRAIDILKSADISGRVIDMRPAKDPDEFIKAYGSEAFQKRIDEAENSFYFLIRTIEGDYNQSDPEQRTLFYKAIAVKLCENFPEPLERENYLQAICERYGINTDNMRNLVTEFASAKLATPVYQKPKQAVPNKALQEDSGKVAESMLLTWLTDEPAMLPKIKKYIGIEDFTDEIYRKVAERVFSDIENDCLDPPAVIDSFEEEEKNLVANIFQAKMPEITSEEERKRAFSDIIIRVKENSYNFFSENIGNDMSKMMDSIKRKKELESLKQKGVSLV